MALDQGNLHLTYSSTDCILHLNNIYCLMKQSMLRGFSSFFFFYYMNEVD